MRNINSVIILLTVNLFLFGCVAKIEEGAAANTPRINRIENFNPIDKDLDKIKEDGKLVAITGYNAYSYFIYKGQPMGYEYELLKRLAADLDIELEIVIIHELEEMIRALNDGRGDLIAFNLTVTKERKNSISFTEHHTLTPQVLIQKKPDNWRQMKLHQINKMMIRSPIDLIDKPLTIRRTSSYATRLTNLSDEIGEDLDILECDPEISTEDLIAMVAEGEIEYTVSDKNIAELYSGYYPILDIEFTISLPQRIAWAARKNSPDLLSAINEWLKKEKKKNDYYTIYDRYFKHTKSFKKRIISEYFSLTGGKISKYDNEIKKNAYKLGWDWRLLASLIYQESQFKPDRTSWAGAKGLMQLMPATAKQFGAKNPNNIHQNLTAGTNYLLWLTDYWDNNVTDSIELQKFVLASYNIGPGHIQDATNLAEKYGADQNTWFDNVEKFLLKKSQAKYYNDEVIQFGYAKGKETVKYVSEILDRYEQYKKFIKE
ncbi:MAG: transporter substrate-binding domain-containing protein [Bacteroidota bacterium]